MNSNSTICLAGFLILFTVHLSADPVAVGGPWISPNGDYVAKIQQSENGQQISIGPAKSDDPTIPITQDVKLFHGAPAKGYWKGNREFRLYYIKEQQYFAPDFVQPEIAEKIITLAQTAGKATYLTPDIQDYANQPSGHMDYRLDDFLFSGPIDQTKQMNPAFFVTAEWIRNDSVDWSGPNEVQICSHQLLHTSDGKRSFKASWIVTEKTSENVRGFEPKSISQIRVVEIDSKTNSETEIKLPDPSLALAVEMNEPSSVEQALLRGDDPNGMDKQGQGTVLNRAVLDKSVGIIKLLLDKGAKPTGEDLCDAAATRDMEIFDQIFVERPKLDSNDPYYVYQSFIRNPSFVMISDAEWLSDLSHITEQFKQNGINLNARDQSTGDTVLTLLARYGFTDAITVMLKAGADPTLKNRKGESSADVAARQFQIPALRLLDRTGNYNQLIKDWAIPLDSPFLGRWNVGGYIEGLLLSPDGSGFLVGMASGAVTWKIDGKMIRLYLHFPGRGDPAILRATGLLTSRGQSLVFKFDEGQNNVPSAEWIFSKGPGDK